MSSRLPAADAQIAFALQAHRTGCRETVTLQFTSPSGSWAAVDVYEAVESVRIMNPALSHRIRFSKGRAYQEWVPGGCDFLEVRAVSGAQQAISDAVDSFKRTLDGAAMAVRLIRTPATDHLVMTFDHALVDELSLALIVRQFSAPPRRSCNELARYRSAVEDSVAAEAKARVGAGVMFWDKRLKDVHGRFPQIRGAGGVSVPTTSLVVVKIPMSVKGSLFPHVLFALHRALRDVRPDCGPAVIGYPWGGRNSGLPDLVGCFMNTAVSIEPTGLSPGPEAVSDFRRTWLRELDHANVPFTVLTGLGAGFTGAVTAYLNYTHARQRTVSIAGVEATRAPPADHGEVPVTAGSLALATVADGEIRLRLFVNDDCFIQSREHLAERWRHWLEFAVAATRRD